MGVNWSAGLEGLDRRFMPYNGIVAQDQLAWLDKYEKTNWTHVLVMLGQSPIGEYCHIAMVCASAFLRKETSHDP